MKMTASESKAFYEGMKAAAEWIEVWDTQLAPCTGGLRFSDMLLCKFNLTRRKKPRRAPVAVPARASKAGG
jgi:hypothetical protein